MELPRSKKYWMGFVIFHKNMSGQILQRLVIASKTQIQNQASAAAEVWILNFGIKSRKVASKVQESKFGRCRGRILN